MQYSFYGGRRGYKGDTGETGASASDSIKKIKAVDAKNLDGWNENVKQYADDAIIVYSESMNGDEVQRTVLFIIGSSDVIYTTEATKNEDVNCGIEEISYSMPTTLQSYIKDTEPSEGYPEEGYGKFTFNMSNGDKKVVNVNTITGFSIDENKHLIVSTSEGHFDAGSMAYGGIYIGKNYTWVTFNLAITEYNNLANEADRLDLIDGRELYTNYHKIITALNALYPKGLTEKGIEGKLITYSDTEDESKVIFGFDYGNNTWYYVGTMNEDISYISSCIIVGGVNRSIPEAVKLPQGGLWFKTEDANIDPVPLEAQSKGNLNYRCAFVCDEDAWQSVNDNNVDVINEKLSIIRDNARAGSVVFTFERINNEEEKVFTIYVNTQLIKFSGEEVESLFNKNIYGDLLPTSWENFKVVLFGEDGTKTYLIDTLKVKDEVSDEVTLGFYDIDGEKIAGTWVSYSKLVVNESYNALDELGINITNEVSAQDLEFFFPLYALKGYTSAIKDDDIIHTGDKFYLGYGFQTWYYYTIACRSASTLSKIEMNKK